MASNMKAVKLRIKSVQSTMQITKAMELVASSKLRHARERMEQARPYFETLQATLADIAAANTEFTSPYLARRPVKKTCYIVIAGDRGLAGGSVQAGGSGCRRQRVLCAARGQKGAGALPAPGHEHPHRGVQPGGGCDRERLLLHVPPGGPGLFEGRVR